MRRKLKVIVPVLLTLLLALVAVIYVRRFSVPILEPRGIVGEKERSLLGFTLLLGLGVVIPVFILTIAIAWRYRESNPKKVSYTPDWSTNKLFETIWWGIPIVIIGVLCVVTWRTTHQLDPYKQLASTKQTMKIQVISLDWKWLFLYPDQGIATVNVAAIPKDTPVDFQITSDTVMTSFWVPQLGGQIYAMPSMTTHLNLMANQTGSFAGSAANISGKGFAGMKFSVKSMDDQSFNSWVKQAKQSPNTLDRAGYESLYKPSENNLDSFYKSYKSNLFEDIIMKYMMPMPGDEHAPQVHKNTQLSGDAMQPEKDYSTKQDGLSGMPGMSDGNSNMEMK